MSDQGQIAVAYTADVPPAEATDATERKLADLYGRIDRVIASNRRSESIAIGLCIALALVGLGVLIYAVATQSIGFGVVGALVEISVAWPIIQIIRLREKNILLSSMPGVLAGLPPDKEAEAWLKILDKYLT